MFIHSIKLIRIIQAEDIKEVSSFFKTFQKDLFALSEADFEEKCLTLFRFQYTHNKVYRKYCELINRTVKDVKCIEDIPFLPISAFKSHSLKTTDWEAEIVFESSGTTGMATSKHYVKSVEIYRQSFLKCFEHFYGQLDDYVVLALLPSYLERSGSSLIYMVEDFIQRSGREESGFYLNNRQALYEKLCELNQNNQKVLLIGVSFALLDFVEEYQLKKNPELVVMETGGMKGRRKEILREELHRQLKTGFSVAHIHSEYGMTELLSQAYSRKNGRFETPNWMKVLLRKQDDPFSYAAIGETGAINIIDLANIYSIAFIQTDDLGRMHEDGSFEVLGRFDQATVRGCNLMVV